MAEGAKDLAVKRNDLSLSPQGPLSRKELIPTDFSLTPPAHVHTCARTHIHPPNVLKSKPKLIRINQKKVPMCWK